jgi:folate-dependent tRNA-U54 methylase TrmFO/GidA
MSPRDDYLRVRGVENLFCAGEKAGLLVGHTEALVTGTLAGYNSACRARNEALLALPPSLATGDAIAFVRTQMETEAGLGYKYTFSGSVYFERLKKKGFYSIDRKAIEERVAKAGMIGVFAK